MFASMFRAVAATRSAAPSKLDAIDLSKRPTMLARPRSTPWTAKLTTCTMPRAPSAAWANATATMTRKVCDRCHRTTKRPARAAIPAITSPAGLAAIATFSAHCAAVIAL